ncbi:HK97 family phage prohead protease [Pseudoduganella sp. UC29_106]|uniref:HK97 family phage prohead protease n=1 Tax=Pseudoduganella sp. UC29_106 TaxID=3374553 RepID=UPI00375734BC
MTMQRAYSLLEVKEFDEEQRVIHGMATTPTPDRTGDIVEPMGIQVAPDIPLFLYHDSHLTVGRVKFGKPTKQGVPYEASLPKVVELGNLRDRVDEAWQMLKYKLITGVSIGFRVIDGAYEILKGGGIRFLKTEVLELSLVPIPMNAEATITSIKSADEAIRRAAFGNNGSRVVRLSAEDISKSSPGASGTEKPRLPGVVYLK